MNNNYKPIIESKLSSDKNITIQYVDDNFFSTNAAATANIPKDYIVVDINKSYIVKKNKRNLLLVDLKTSPLNWKPKTVKFLDNLVVSFL